MRGKQKNFENRAQGAEAPPATSATMAEMAPAHLAALISKEPNAGHEQRAESAQCGVAGGDTQQAKVDAAQRAARPLSKRTRTSRARTLEAAAAALYLQ